MIILQDNQVILILLINVTKSFHTICRTEIKTTFIHLIFWTYGHFVFVVHWLSGSITMMMNLCNGQDTHTNNPPRYHGGVIGWGFWRYDITTAEIDNIKLLSVCLVSSDALEFAKLMKEQYTAHQAHHFSFIIRPHILKIMPRRFM